MPSATPAAPGRYPSLKVFVAAVVLGSAAFGGAPACRAQEEKRDTLTYAGTADIRYRDTDKETRGSYVAATRLQGDWTRRDVPSGAVKGGARVQVFLETDGRRGTAVNRLRASEVYAFYDFTLSGVSGRLRAGQFALPFGLTSVYDPLQPVQPLYEKSLGLRVDAGVMLEGEYGPYGYAVSVTTGAGPNRSDFDANKMVSFRLNRVVETTVGRFEVGGSLLTGRGPRTAFDTELPASGTSDIRDFVDKTRFGGDGQYFFGALTLRGEIVFGGDGPDAVWGYFAEGNYRVTPRVTLVAMRKLWNFPQKPMSSATTGVGANYDFGGGVTLRALYEFQRDVPLPEGTRPEVVKRFTLQTRLRF